MKLKTKISRHDCVTHKTRIKETRTKRLAVTVIASELKGEEGIAECATTGVILPRSLDSFLQPASPPADQSTDQPRDEHTFVPRCENNLCIISEHLYPFCFINHRGVGRFTALPCDSINKSIEPFKGSQTLPFIFFLLPQFSRGFSCSAQNKCLKVTL